MLAVRAGASLVILAHHGEVAFDGAGALGLARAGGIGE